MMISALLDFRTDSETGSVVAKVQLWGYRCERCGHEWLPRKGEEPKVCPKCKSPYWNTPRKRNRTPPPEQQAPAPEGVKGEPR